MSSRANQRGLSYKGVKILFWGSAEGGIQKRESKILFDQALLAMLNLVASYTICKQQWENYCWFILEVNPES